MTREKHNISQPRRNWHALSIEETLSSLNATTKGLELKEAEERIVQYGKNEIPEKNGDKIIALIINQLKSPLIYVLMIAGTISILLKNFIDAGIIWGTVILNTAIGFSQEFKASKILEHLSESLSYNATVLREGKIKIIDAKNIVLGDILIIKQGDKISADGRIIDSSNFKTNEAVLTGESSPVEKSSSVLPENTASADRSNMVYLGTYAEEGAAKIVVTATGINTEFGKIASIIKKKEGEEETPLKNWFKKLSETLVVAFLGITTLIFVLGIIKDLDPATMIMISVAIAVSAIPEALPVALTTTLAIGARNIFKTGGLVRKIIAAETLGSATLIAVDKTATLTEGKMSITKIITADGSEISGDKIEDIKNMQEDSSFYQTMKTLALVNDALIENPSAPIDQWEIYGKPIDKAVLFTTEKSGFKKEETDRENPRIFEIPFGAAHKYTATLNKYGDEKNIIITFGAPEVIWQSSNCFHTDSGECKNISKEKIKEFEKTLTDMAKNGLKVLAIGYKLVPKDEKEISHSKIKDMTFLSFIGFSDPIRKEVYESIQLSKNAGVKVIMVTGDHALTAKYVARELKMFQDGDESRLIEGRDLEKNPELLKKWKDYDVFARINPEYKVKIIEAAKEDGEIVAMIGDGINDAPALIKANLGVAVGAGTDIAKEASDLILLNNSFSIIVGAIRQGRIILDNIRKAAVYLLSNAFSEILIIPAALLAGMPLPLLPAQILWVNLFGSSFPSISLAFEEAEGDVMKRKPEKSQKILRKDLTYLLVSFTVISNIALLLLFYYTFKITDNIDYARTMTFGGLGITSLIYVFSIKTLSVPIWREKIFSNKLMVGAVLLGIALYLVSIYSPISFILNTVPLKMTDWAILGGLSIFNVVIIEIGKRIFVR